MEKTLSPLGDKQCRGRNNRGERCNRTVLNESYCHNHNINHNHNVNYNVNRKSKKVIVFRNKDGKIINPGKLVVPEEKCPICIELISQREDDADLECGHAIHTLCAKQLHNDQCPVCRSSLKSEKLSKKDLKVINQKKTHDDIQREGESFNEFMRNDQPFGNHSLGDDDIHIRIVFRILGLMENMREFMNNITEDILFLNRSYERSMHMMINAISRQLVVRYGTDEMLPDLGECIARNLDFMFPEIGISFIRDDVWDLIMLDDE